LDDVVVDVALNPDPPRVGTASVVVKMQDKAGQPIVGATVSLEGNMNHAGMVPVLADAFEFAPGNYQADLDFNMGGDWFILVYATLADGRSLQHQVDVPAVDAFCGTPAP
jgi:hypothetical protein